MYKAVYERTFGLTEDMDDELQEQYFIHRPPRLGCQTQRHMMQVDGTLDQRLLIWFSLQNFHPSSTTIRCLQLQLL